eukprot:gene12806-27000_t
MDSFLQVVMHYFVSGTVKQGGSWGETCSRAVQMNIHIIETIAWMAISVVIFYGFNVPWRLQKLASRMKSEMKKYTKKSSYIRAAEIIMGLIHMLMYIQIIYYKTNKRSLVNLVQPCHLVLLVQGLALLAPDIASGFISVLSLPMVVGTVLAMLFPDTTGLDQPFEELSYWIQHVLILVMPLYLLVRNNFVAGVVSSLETVCLSSWMVLLLHWPCYEVLDVSFQVNIMFMLCPTGAMHSAFAHFPSWILWPSYRSTLTVVFFAVSVVLSATFILVARTLRRLVQQSVAVDEKTQ